MGDRTRTSLMLEGRKYLILGATGNLGRPIMDLLLWQGANVIAVAKSEEKLIQAQHEIGQSRQRVKFLSLDLPGGIHHLESTVSRRPHLDGIIYALGYFPPRGFSDGVKDTLLSKQSGFKIVRDYSLHVAILIECANTVIGYLPKHSHFLVLGSAITELPWDKIPPVLHAGHYAMATAAKEQYVKYLRLDSKILAKHILVHYLAPGAVNTAFHQCMPPQLRPPAMLSTDDVANEVLLALLSKKSVHKLWQAKPK